MNFSDSQDPLREEVSERLSSILGGIDDATGIPGYGVKNPQLTAAIYRAERDWEDSDE